MADYIDSNIICQAYVHIEALDFPDEKLEALRQEIELFLTTRGRFFLYSEIGSSVEFQEGSLKVYATIVGSLYLAIGQYASFRDGVEYLAQDAKRLAECVASESLFMSQSRRDSIIRVEARTGVAGKLKSIVDSLELIGANLAESDAKQSSVLIAEQARRVESLLADLQDPADPPFVKSGLCAIIKSVLPESPPPRKPPKKPHTVEGIAYYRTERRNLLRIATA